MKMHTLQYKNIKDFIGCEETIETNIDGVDNVAVDLNTLSISFTTPITLRGQALEAAVMSTRTSSYTVNQDY